MARRKQGGADVILEMVAKLPWWAGVSLAVAAYFGFHHLSELPAPKTFQPGEMADFIGKTLIVQLSAVLQYVVPMLCLVAAFASFVGRHKRATNLDRVTRSGSAESLNAMTWQAFELLVSDAFKRQGYQVTETGGAAPDGGVDLVLRKNDETYLVQCKQWRAFKVGVEIVRELYGLMAAHGAAGGFVVTSGQFTSEARSFAEGRNVQLVDGTRLHAMIRQVGIAQTVKSPLPAQEQQPPACPTCGSAMVRRTAKKGARAGSEFWGCSRYPQCRGTR